MDARSARCREGGRTGREQGNRGGGDGALEARRVHTTPLLEQQARDAVRTGDRDKGSGHAMLRYAMRRARRLLLKRRARREVREEVRDAFLVSGRGAGGGNRALTARTTRILRAAVFDPTETKRERGGEGGGARHEQSRNSQQIET